MRLKLLLGIVIAIITLATYWQVGDHDFINLDDDVFITNNDHVATGLTRENVLWALKPVPELGWFPVAWLSHMVDVELYGLNPRGHHLTNVCFHIAAALLLFTLMCRTTAAPWPSAFVAALFALHPLHVESVAWLAERRDVLSAFFGFLALLLYVEFVQRGRRRLYVGALIAFLLGLMSKPMLVTLPILMLLLDFWPLNRFSLPCERPEAQVKFDHPAWVAIIREKLPFVAGSLLTVWIALAGPGSSMMNRYVDSLPWDLRAANIVTVYVKYLGKMLWPADLAIFYPFPRTIPLWLTIGSLLVLLTVTGLVLRAGRRQRYLVVGWFWYLVGIVPVSGLVPIGTHAMADRYTYLPLTGIFIIIAWGATELGRKKPGAQYAVAFMAGLVILAATVVSWKQIGYWRDDITLYRHSIEVAPEGFLIHNNLGVALLEKDQIDEALMEFKQAIDLYPYYNRSHLNYGYALAKRGQLDDAIVKYQKTLEINPQSNDAHNNLGVVYAQKGVIDKAVAEFRQAVEIYPDYYAAYVNWGHALAGQGRLDEAMAKYRQALKINMNAIDAHVGLGNVLYRVGRLVEAIDEYRKTLQLNPDFLPAHYNLGVTLARRGDLPAAVEEYRKVLAVDPGHAGARSELERALRSQSYSNAESGARLR